MKSRRRQGATLGLVAVCVLVIIVLGVGCFFLAKIFGGGREVANATDAGALNIAKFAMKEQDPLSRVSVALPGNSNAYADFVPLADPPGSNEINLLTYNRCVAQALLVALNAQAEGTPTAATNAGLVITALNNLGTELNAKLADKKVVSFFTQVKNGTKMWGNNALNPQSTSYTVAFMKKKESTNVYFPPTIFTAAPSEIGALPGNWKSIGTSKTPQQPSTGYYLRGYEDMNVPGIGSIMGVPVFPQQNPHLVSLGDFKNQAAAAPNTHVPPNAFSIAASSVDSKSGVTGGAIAAAIVGASVNRANNGGAANYDFAASFPGGYLSIVNAASATLPAGSQAFDQQDNIFNNELFFAPGIHAIGTGGGAAFTTNPNAFSAWAAYNNSSATNPSGGGQTIATYQAGTGGRNKLLDPMTSSYNGGPYATAIYTANNPNAAGSNNPPDVTQLQTIKSPSTDCLAQMNSAQSNYFVQDVGNVPAIGSGPCAAYLKSFELSYGHGAPTGGSNNSGLYTNVDIAKGQLIGAFQSGQKSANVVGSENEPVGSPLHNPSGLGLFETSMNGAYPQPAYNPGGSIEKTGTIDQLLDQVTAASGPNNQMNATPMGSCTKTKLLAALSQRCYEIKPTATAVEINALWNTPLPIGQTAYIYLDKNSNMLRTFGQANPPTTLVSTGGISTAADGPAQDQNLSCENNYPLDGSVIDVEKANGHPADNNLHDRPYTVMNGGSVVGHDHATLQLSSGFNNFLGQLSFSNTTEGVESFSRPN